ncbi:hypothetical protein N9Y17_04590 [Gammaproteobacteria bacterium]|nr:hypothetical protein [Gammaproteobacteria bacterium]
MPNLPYPTPSLHACLLELAEQSGLNEISWHTATASQLHHQLAGYTESKR